MLDDSAHFVPHQADGLPHEIYRRDTDCNEETEKRCRPRQCFFCRRQKFWADIIEKAKRASAGSIFERPKVLPAAGARASPLFDYQGARRQRGHDSRQRRLKVRYKLMMICR